MAQTGTIKTPPHARPLVVEVTRGDMVESRHHVAVAVVDRAGRATLVMGDVARPVYPRSAIKPLQALPLIETGAADRYGLGQAEIALACASHSGEPRHVEAVLAWLARIGCRVDDLECGSHMPYHDETVAGLIRGSAEPTAAHNNCSGKHAGFLSTARHLGEATKGYIRFEHPVQQRILGALEQMAGVSLSRAPRGIDGCGIPVLGLPLSNLAWAMARLADPDELPERRASAARRILAAMAAEPFMVAGSDRFCTTVMTLTGETAVIKTGAEGLYCGALPGRGLGVALKVEDGAGRAAEVAMGEVLRRLGVLTAAQQATLADQLTPPVRNRVGLITGRVRPAQGDRA